MFLLGCFSQVDDISAAIVDLKAKNIRTLSAEPRIGAHGKPVMFLHPKDCDGVLVELEEAWICHIYSLHLEGFVSFNLCFVNKSDVWDFHFVKYSDSSCLFLQ